MLVSLADLAMMPGIPNRTTLGRLIKHNPDFPIVSRGCAGRPYLVDYDEARAFIALLKSSPPLTAERRALVARALRLHPSSDCENCQDLTQDEQHSNQSPAPAEKQSKAAR